MEIFATDCVIGSFVSSNYALDIVSFEYDGESEDEVFSVETKEEFIGENPFVQYLGQNYNFKLEGTLTLMRNLCNVRSSELSEYDCREVLRALTGFRGYQWMQLLTEDVGEELWYRARIKSVKIKRVNGKAVGFIIEIMTDSYMCYSREYTYEYNLSSNERFEMFLVTDDLANYVYPQVYITPLSSGNFTLTAPNDQSITYPSGFITRINNVTANKTYFLDGKYKLFEGTTLEDFNMHWPRFLPENNVFIPNMDCKIKFVYRCPRKAGFICQ